MTIFHTLKYPISDPPTKEELKALPNEVWEEWITHIIVHGDTKIEPGYVASVLRTHLYKHEMYPYELQRLKDIIQRYEGEL